MFLQRHQVTKPAVQFMSFGLFPYEDAAFWSPGTKKHPSYPVGLRLAAPETVGQLRCQHLKSLCESTLFAEREVKEPKGEGSGTSNWPCAL